MERRTEGDSQGQQMEEALELSGGWKPMTSPSKVAVERAKVKDKVEKSSKKRRQNMTTDKQREQRLSELRLAEIRENPERMRLAQNINVRADELMIGHGLAYPEGVKLAAEDYVEQGAAEPSVAEVERYMKEHKVEDFGQAVREVARERGLVQSPVDNSAEALGPPSTGGTTPADEDAEIRRIAKERGYDL